MKRVIEKVRNSGQGFWGLVPKHLTLDTTVVLRTLDTMYFGRPAVVAAARARWDADGKVAKDGRYRLHPVDLHGFEAFKIFRSRAMRA